MRLTFGADPEIILARSDTGEVFPACGTFQGSKECPVPIPGMSKGYNMHVDNVMLEFSIPHAGSPEEMVNNTYLAMVALMDMLRTEYGGAYEITDKCSMLFPNRLLSFPQAFEFGCSPDFSAYGTAGEPAPSMTREAVDRGTGELRFAGGHVHLGYDISKVPQFAMAMLMDALVGLPMLLHEEQGERRKFYGQAGRFRNTPYGIEYRTPCNKWAVDEDAMAAMTGFLSGVVRVLDRSSTAIQDFLHSLPMPSIRTAIDTEDTRAAETISGMIQRELHKNG